jgi:hypothetical protein
MTWSFLPLPEKGERSRKKKERSKRKELGKRA